MFGHKKYKIRPINEVFDLQLGKLHPEQNLNIGVQITINGYPLQIWADMIDSHRVHQNI